MSIFEPDPNRKQKMPTRDWIWWSGYAVLVLQLALAAVAWAFWGDLATLAVTLAGTALAFASASLPQWRAERWQCREKTEKSFVLCRGNGAQHALVVLGNGSGIDLEDLAGAGKKVMMYASARLGMVLSTAAWAALLIAVSALKTQTWFLVGIGAVGMLHSVFVAGKTRSPSTFGIHLVPRGYVLKEDVMKTLKAAELRYPGIGLSMLPTFFPGSLKDAAEREFWEELKETKEKRQQEKRQSIELSRKSTS